MRGKVLKFLIGKCSVFQEGELMNSWQYVLKFEIREFLKFLMAKKKLRNSRFSQRAFAAHIGLTPTTFNEILMGKRKLSRKSITKIVAAVEQDKDFEEYFNEYAQGPSASVSGSSKNIELKDGAFAQLLELSDIARKTDSKDPIFCTLLVATNQIDFELLRTKILNAVKAECQFQDVYELSFSCVNASCQVL